MLTAKKITKTMTSFGGSIVSSITTPLKNVNNNGIINNNNKTGLVTIVNIDPNLKYFSTNFKLNKVSVLFNLFFGCCPQIFCPQKIFCFYINFLILGGN